MPFATAPNFLNSYGIAHLRGLLPFGDLRFLYDECIVYIISRTVRIEGETQSISSVWEYCREYNGIIGNRNFGRFRLVRTYCVLLLQGHRNIRIHILLNGVCYLDLCRPLDQRQTNPVRIPVVFHGCDVCGLLLPLLQGI